MQIAASFASWVGVGDPWMRPTPTSWRPDVVLTSIVTCLVVLDAVLQNSISRHDSPTWQVAAVGVVGALLLLPRRRFPLATMLASGLWLFIAAGLVPESPALMSLQFACFYAVYSGAAWTRDRQLLLMGACALLTVVLVWIAWTFAVGSGLDRVLAMQAKSPGAGPLPPVVAMVLFSFLLNMFFFAGAFTMGTIAWKQARDTALIAEQARQIAAHQLEVRDQAVVDERLRIARDLHDVVAHHVSVMGIQASGARKVMSRDPQAAEAALTRVEESARQAVGEMRNLLGTLRSPDGSSAPPPRLAQITDLADVDGRPSVQVRIIGPDIALPEPVALSIYRIAQESLNNVRKHSTARTVDVVVRRDPAYVEVEVVDDGHPRTGTSGTGLGQEGIRERVAAFRGSVDIGPRTGCTGYRVRARIPLQKVTP